METKHLTNEDMCYEDLENRVSALEEIVIDSGQTKREYLFRVAMNGIKNSEQKYDVKNYVFELYDSRETYKWFFYISLFFNFVFVWMLFYFN